jgi:UDP-glucose 4-epimerase
MKRIFLTGGAGFIGSHIVDMLLPKGHEITVYDDLSTGRRADIAQHEGKDGFRFVEGSILHSGLQRAMHGHDLVWHLAAGTIMQNRSGFDDLLANTIGTFNVLEAAKNCEIHQFMYASTAAAYGDHPGQPLSEGYGPMAPISTYGASKLAAEPFVSAYSHLYGMESWIFRFGNVVGGGMGHGVIHDFVRKLQKDPAKLEIWGDGKGTKPFFTVEDCIAGMLCCYRGRLEAELPGGRCDTYNLGCDGFTSVDRVAEIVIGEMGLKDVVLSHTGGRQGFPGDVPCVLLSSAKAESYGWKARHTSDEAVRIAAQRIIRGTR